MSETPEYLSASQAAAYLALNIRRIHALARDGRIGRKLGGYWMFTHEELDRYDRSRGDGRGGRPKKEKAI